MLHTELSTNSVIHILSNDNKNIEFKKKRTKVACEYWDSIFCLIKISFSLILPRTINVAFARNKTIFKIFFYLHT